MLKAVWMHDKKCLDSRIAYNDFAKAVESMHEGNILDYSPLIIYQ